LRLIDGALCISTGLLLGFLFWVPELGGSVYTSVAATVMIGMGLLSFRAAVKQPRL
jgi:glucose dehydrogenase